MLGRVQDKAVAGAQPSADHDGEGAGTLKTRPPADTGEKARFQDILHQAITEGMSNVLGEGGMRAVLYHLGLDRHSEDSKKFHQGLEATFKGGTTILEKVIVKEFYLKLGVPYGEREPFDFEEQVSLAMQAASSRPRGRES